MMSIPQPTHPEPVDFQEIQRRVWESYRNIGKPGYNEFGVPLHACNGHRQDEHYWTWLGAKRRGEA